MTKSREKIMLFLIGALCFFITQILLRLPLLSILQKNLLWNQWILAYPFIFSLIVAFSAGFFEEGGRVLFRKFLLQAPGENQGYFPFSDAWECPLIFGLGHGICELVFLLQLSHPTNPIFYLYFLGERIIAVVFHIGMSFLIFRGCSQHRGGQAFLLALFLHGFFDSLIFFLSWSDMAVYGLWIIGDLLIINRILTVRKEAYDEKH